MEISRRDYFAGLAMQEILTSKLSKEMNLTKDNFNTHIAEQSFSLADEMIVNQNELLNTLYGLVSDVGNLLSDYDIEWQQAGYYNQAKELLSKYI